MKTLEQLDREIQEMWDAVNDIPESDPGRDKAIQEAHAIDIKMRLRHDWDAAFWRKVSDGKIPVGNLTFTAKPLEDDWDWIEFEIHQIGSSDAGDDVVFISHPIGDPTACYLSTLALKIK